MAKKIEKNKEVDFVRVSAIVGVIAVILVASMFVSVSITGNVIRQNNYKYGRYSVYTKEEVDSLIRSVSAGSGSSVDVYDKIRDLEIVEASVYTLTKDDTDSENLIGIPMKGCSLTCSKVFNSTCVIGMLNMYADPYSGDYSFEKTTFFGCGLTSSRAGKLICLCEPPVNTNHNTTNKR